MLMICDAERRGLTRMRIAATFASNIGDFSALRLSSKQFSLRRRRTEAFGNAYP